MIANHVGATRALVQIQSHGPFNGAAMKDAKPNSKPRKMPSALAIRKHWAEALWSIKGFDSIDEFMDPLPCFACGMHFGKLKPERSHIKARVEGGGDNVENLHMLCRYCHKDSEILQGDRYWSWFYARNSYDMLLSAASRGGLNLSQLLVSKST